MDYFDVTETFPKFIKFNSEYNNHIHHCIISFTSDWLFPTIENKEIVKILNKEGKRVSFTEIESDKGHDSFLLNVPELYRTIAGFLDGSIAFFDAALWHAVGRSSKKSRWGVFNMYGPWFMKPYYDFGCMFTDKKFESMTPLQQQLLHYDSRPVPNIDAGFATLRRVRDKLATR